MLPDCEYCINPPRYPRHCPWAAGTEGAREGRKRDCRYSPPLRAVSVLSAFSVFRRMCFPIELRPREEEPLRLRSSSQLNTSISPLTTAPKFALSRGRRGRPAQHLSIHLNGPVLSLQSCRPAPTSRAPTTPYSCKPAATVAAAIVL
jgi:hypothetical protein